MYKYLKTWPSDRENGWSEELNGICHDANNWFFTQNGNLWKFPITHKINDKVTGENREKGITYWDLNKDTRAPEISGVLHAIMIDNVGVGDDDFYFKHYDRIQ